MADVREARALDEVVAAVGHARPHLVDAWEAVALIESLGFTDARVQRECGLADTKALGEYVFERLSERPVSTPRADSDPAAQTSPPRLRDSARASLVYAVPWIVMMVLVQSGVPRLTPIVAPLRLAMMISLIVTGGFMQAIGRRGRFYSGMGQPVLARLVSWYFVRLGVIATLATAGLGLLLGRLFDVATGPYVVLWADELLILCALWLGVAAAQVPAVVAPPKGAAPVPIPRMTVLAFRALPIVLFGTLAFCFVFADRLAAGASSGLPPGYALGMDLAVTSLFLSAAGIEHANAGMMRGLMQQAQRSRVSGANLFRRAAGRLHLRALGTVAIAFVGAAVMVAAIAAWLPTDVAPFAWTTLAIGDAGYLLCAFGLLNSLVLIAMHRPWSAVNALVAGVALNVVVGFVAGRAFGANDVPAGLIAGAALIAVQSSVSVRRALRRADYAVAAIFG